jgi:hypothetical protein
MRWMWEDPKKTLRSWIVCVVLWRNDEEKTSQIENPFIPNYSNEPAPNYSNEIAPNEPVPNYSSNEIAPNEVVPNEPVPPVPNYSSNEYAPNELTPNELAPNEPDSKRPYIFEPPLANGGIKKKNKTIKKKKRKSKK